MAIFPLSRPWPARNNRGNVHPLLDQVAKIVQEARAVKQQYEEELKSKIDVLAKEIQGMRTTFDRIRANPRVDAAEIILLQANL